MMMMFDCIDDKADKHASDNDDDDDEAVVGEVMMCLVFRPLPIMLFLECLSHPLEIVTCVDLWPSLLLFVLPLQLLLLLLLR